MRAANLALRFVLELGALAALAYWGIHTGPSRTIHWFLGVGAPLVAALVWGLFIAPRRRFDVPEWLWILLQVIVFGAAVAGLIATDQPALAVVFAGAVVLNASLIVLWHQRGDPTDLLDGRR